MEVNKPTNGGEQAYKWRWTSLQMEVNKPTNGGEQAYKWRWTSLQMEVNKPTNGGEQAYKWRWTCLLVGCLTSQQHASVSQGRSCSDNFTCCHTEIEATDQTFYLTQSQYTDTGPTSPSADPTTPGTWQGSHWSAKFWVTGMTRPKKNPGASGIRTWDLPLLRWTPYH